MVVIFHMCGAGAIPHPFSTADLRTHTTPMLFCGAEGQSQFKVNGKSIATATAQAWASAFAEATATASVCNKCSSKASVFASVVEDVIITATAKAEFDISSAKGGPVQVVQIIDRVIKEGTIVAIATVRLSHTMLSCGIPVPAPTVCP